MTFVIVFTCSLPSFNDMSKHSLVLWPLLLLLLWGGGGLVFFFFGGGRGCYVLFKKRFCGFFFVFFCFLFFVFVFSFFDGKYVMSALCTYYYMCMFV